MSGFWDTVKHTARGCAGHKGPANGSVPNRIGISVNVWNCGLASLELCIERVKARVARGGHNIPEHLTRSRHQTSMQNLCVLATRLHRPAVYDNSQPFFWSPTSLW
jgi:predicted ABC-type ATPase